PAHAVVNHRLLRRILPWGYETRTHDGHLPVEIHRVKTFPRLKEFPLLLGVLLMDSVDGAVAARGVTWVRVHAGISGLRGDPPPAVIRRIADRSLPISSRFATHSLPIAVRFRARVGSASRHMAHTACSSLPACHRLSMPNLTAFIQMARTGRDLNTAERQHLRKILGED
ncbi:MAG: hypothetical protein NTW21_03315, partial [Verrucomicrobia bacterium]|nr:hypothetical protein [Verrucomicrobiota bacterium]